MQPLRLTGLRAGEARMRAEEALGKVDMLDRMKSLPKNLSGGQQQRVAIARALVTEPSIMLCDEPTASLDIRSAGIVMEELRMLASSGKAVVVVTHDLRLRKYADRIIYVDNGVASETPSEEYMSHE
jgi:putative ABC transport system ATP-binding protein